MGFCGGFRAGGMALEIENARSFKNIVFSLFWEFEELGSHVAFFEGFGTTRLEQLNEFLNELLEFRFRR